MEIFPRFLQETIFNALKIVSWWVCCVGLILAVLVGSAVAALNFIQKKKEKK